jgi:hypothetical protein
MHSVYSGPIQVPEHGYCPTAFVLPAHKKPITTSFLFQKMKFLDRYYAFILRAPYKGR